MLRQIILQFSGHQIHSVMPNKYWPHLMKKRSASNWLLWPKVDFAFIIITTVHWISVFKIYILKKNTWVFVSGFGLVIEFEADKMPDAVVIADEILILWIDDGLSVLAIFIKLEELVIFSKAVVDKVESASCCNYF